MSGDSSPVPSCRLQGGDGGHYRLTGSLVLETAAGVLAQGEAAFAGEPRARVDLSGVSDADSAGLAVLIEWTRAARQGGRRIVFEALPARLAGLAHIGGVAELLPVTD